MKVIHYSEAPSKRMDGETVKGVTGRVTIGKDDGAENFCMRVFELDKDGFTPRHVHEWEHEIVVIDGNGEFFKEGKWISASKGYTVFIPGMEEHQIRNAGDEKFIFACLIPKGVQEL
ncbi:MAG: cupin domain-containing protein [Desulfobacterales bacterium]|nr:cupin domain-containing protein [Desulfobacterales bacterium]MCP4158580.1 cupin domain-containing protein [Deltaproteobacteria bacterium]